MGDLQGYTMPDALAKIIKPMPAGLIRLITLKQLNTQAYWVRPVITGAKASACPCCGATHPLAAHGVCGGCYDPTIKKGLFGPALLDHLVRRAKCGKKIRPSGPKVISGEKEYAMEPALASVLRPMSQVEAETATISGLAKFWRRPLIKYNAKSACPCCGGVHRLKNAGICSGCNSDKVAKLNLTGLPLLEHLARRAEGGWATMGLLPGQILSEFIEAECTLSPPRSVPVETLYSAFCLWHKDNLDKGPQPSLKHFNQMIMGGGDQGESWPVKKEQREGKSHYTGISLKCVLKESISPAPESSSPAATPLAGAGQVESKDPSMQLHFIVQAIRLSIGLDDKAPLSAIPKHIDKLLTNLKHLKEQNDLADIQLALGLTPFDTVADILEKITRIGQMRSDESAMAMREINKNLELTSKNRELTEEITTLNRLLAKEPSRGPDRGQRETCESILGILGIGNGFALMAHDTEDEDLEAITAGLIRGAIADGVWRADAIGAQDFTDQDIVAKWSALPVPDGYESLAAVLHEALDQAAHGKGLERHADARPFHDQPIMRETQAVGLGFPAGQARKKILEAVHCCNDHPDRAVADLLGAINYIAATVIAIRAIMVELAA